MPSAVRTRSSSSRTRAHRLPAAGRRPRPPSPRSRSARRPARARGRSPLPPARPGWPGARCTRRPRGCPSRGPRPSPGIGGAQNLVPTLRTTPRRAVRSRSPTSTRPGPSSRPHPRTKAAPRPSSRSTATRSSQSSVASVRIRRATGSQSPRTVGRPAMAGIRRPSARRSAARIIILEGTQPQYGHSPPTSSPSTPRTERPASARRPAASSPPGPRPTTTTSAASFTVRSPQAAQRRWRSAPRSGGGRLGGVHQRADGGRR